MLALLKMTLVGVAVSVIESCGTLAVVVFGFRSAAVNQMWVANPTYWGFSGGANWGVSLGI